MQLFAGRTYNSLCPVVAMLKYLAVRGSLCLDSAMGPFTRPQMVQQVKSALTLAGVDAASCSGHSFQIGAAPTVAANGMNDDLQTLVAGRVTDTISTFIHLVTN